MEILNDFMHLWSEPGHLLYEVSVDVVVNTLFIGLLWPILKRLVRRHDAEVHDISEPEDPLP